MNPSNPQIIERDIAIDAHKHYVVVGGLTTPQFVRAGLVRLEMGKDLPHIVRGGTVRPIAPAEQVWALQAQT